jgi:integrase
MKGDAAMATARKRGNSYRVKVYDKYKKKYVSFTAPTKKDAESLATDYIKNLRPPKKIHEKTVSECIDDYIELKKNILSPTTIGKYVNIKKNQLSGTFLNMELKDLTGIEIQAEINRLSGKYAAKTVINANGLISAVLKTYYPELTYKVTLPKNHKKFKEYPTPDEIMAMFKGEEIELIVLIALWFGLRMSEIRGLKKSDFKNGKLTINRVKVTVGTDTIEKTIAKTYDSNRQIQVPKLIQRKIEGLSSEYITELDNRGIYQRFKRVVKKNGYPDITFHDLRHINASVMLMLGVPDKYAMERGGWNTASTLKRVYQETFSDERQRVDKKIDSYFSEIYSQNYSQKTKPIAAKSRKFRLRKII